MTNKGELVFFLFVIKIALLIIGIVFWFMPYLIASIVLSIPIYGILALFDDNLKYKGLDKLPPDDVE